MIHETATPGARRRARRREARKNEMLDAAMEIVVGDGIEHLTISRLASDLDAAVGALYRYFPGKGALMVALQERAIASFGTFMDAEIERTRSAGDAESWERREVLALLPVLAAFRAYRRFGDSEPALFALIDRSISEPRPLLDDDEAAAIQGVLGPILERAASVLADAALKGALSEGDALARTHILWGAVHGLRHFKKRDARLPPELHSDTLSDQLLRDLLVGWGASRPDVDEATRRV